MTSKRISPRELLSTTTQPQAALGGPLPSFRALLENGQLSRWRLSLGFLLHGFVVAVLLLLPLLATEHLNGTFSPGPASIIPVQRGEPTGKPDVGPPAGSQSPQRTDPLLTIPVRPPDRITAGTALEILQAGPGAGAGGNGIPLGLPDGSVVGLPFPSGVALPAPPPASPPQEPIRVGGRVRAPRLVHRIEPVYPRLAELAGIAGTVVLEAVIGTDGRVQQVEVKGGPGLLIPPAVEAVSQWVYEPTYLNDRPVPVILRVEVQFVLRR